LDIMIVLDKSGSMHGDKLNLCKATIEFLVTQLGEKDKLGLTLFDSNVESFDMLRMNNAGKQKIEEILDRTYDGTCTNLSGGLFKGMEILTNCSNSIISSNATLPSMPEESDVSDEDDNTTVEGDYEGDLNVEVKKKDNTESDKKPRKVLFLLTDGQANEGITNSSQMIATLVNDYLSRDRSIIINTFGYGADHDLQLLQRISEVGHGTYYFVEDNESVADCFADCLSGLLSVCAEDIQINIQGSPGTIIKPMEGQKSIKVECRKAGEASSYNLQIADIRADEEKDIIFELQLPSLEGSAQETALWTAAKVRYQYQDLQKDPEAIVQMEDDLIVPRLSSEELQSIEVINSSEVIYNRLRIHVVNTLSKATQMAQRGNTELARSLLEPLRAQITDAISKIESEYQTKCDALLKDVTDCLAAMRSRYEYESRGRYFMESTISENMNQRSCKAISAHASPMQMQMKSAARGAMSKSKYTSPSPYRPDATYNTLRHANRTPKDTTTPTPTPIRKGSSGFMNMFGFQQAQQPTPASSKPKGKHNQRKKGQKPTHSPRNDKKQSDPKP
jgi:uncharacterized protein YegL